jgi:large subunit ribosomal protein L6
MRKNISESISIPEGVNCKIEDSKLISSKSGVTLTKNIGIMGIAISLKDGAIFFETKKGNKKDFNKIKSQKAHITNLFQGLEGKFFYDLEACNVHFPMTLKVEKNRLAINNFLGEKTPRYADILPGVSVDLKGQKITISSNDKDSAGKTAANFEKATKVRNRDRRIFQDGIFITQKARMETK